MAVTAILVYASPNHLRYLLAQDGAAGGGLNITCTGAASPDLLTDSVTGPIKSLAEAATAGFGSIAAGALTSAMVEALWDSNQVVAAGGTVLTRRKRRTAVCQLSTRSGTVDTAWTARPAASGGNAIIAIAAQAAATSCWLDIVVLEPDSR